MQTFAVINFLDEKGKPNLNIFQGSVFPKVNFFDLECFEKAFRGSVVVGIAFAGHADQKAMLQESFYVIMGGILDAPIRVMNNALGRLSKSHGHGQCGKTQSGINIARNRITDGSSGEQIQNDGQIDKTASDANIGDVGRPNLIGAVTTRF